MNKFAERYRGTELIDEPGIPFSDWEVCLRELDAVNTYLGGHAITVEGVKALLPGRSSEKINILEIGCGGGDNLKAIEKSLGKRNNFHYIGVDINKACTDFAARNCSGFDAEFICSDYRDVKFNSAKPHIIFNSLFCHHFTNNELVEMLGWMANNSTRGFFVNDLQRHPVAHYSIMGLTKMFSRSYLVKNDGPISVLRGFHRKEWEHLLLQAGINRYFIKWRWAFRYLVLVKHEE
ncbi:MAG: methyltransferase domain-containing protein [Chitinophagaceae bacterium]|nr:methyltransferase domain-containing protein [Chitinophagaceae bacterium]